MPSVQTSHYLYVKSSQRNSGTTSSFDIVLPPTMIDSDPELQKIKISLLDFNVPFSWSLINNGYNTITFHDEGRAVTTSVSIPTGNYTYYRLAKKITSLYPFCVCTWLEDQNKMQFAFTSGHTMTFDGIYNILGFTQGTTYQGTTITSDRAMMPLATSHIVINLTNITPTHGSLTLDNIGGEVKPSNILARVPINAEPFRLITYNNPVPQDAGVFTSDNSLQRLEFLLTNEDGVELTFLPDSEMFLKFEVFNLEDTDLEDIKADLQEIKQTLKDLFLIKHLNGLTKPKRIL